MTERGVLPDLNEATKGEPKGYFLIVPPRHAEEEIDLVAMLRILLGSWKILFGVTLLSAIIAAGLSLQMRKSYRAQALITRVAQGGGAAGALRGLGGLASLAGIDLRGGGNKGEEALATLSSPGFARDFIATENLIPILFDEDWEAKANRWRDGVTPPSLEKAVRKFNQGVRSIAEDRKTGLITVAVEWYSPELAARWANRMIEMVNERLRSEAIRDAEQSIEYLNNELNKTNMLEARQAIYRLVEGQLNNAMLANVQHEYAFRIIDRAVAPEIRSSPKRTLIVLVGAGMGFILAVMLVFVRHLFRRDKA